MPEITSAATDPVTVTLSPPAWWIKDPLDPTKNQPVSVRPGFSLKRTANTGIFEVEGRSTPIAVVGPLGSYRGSLALRTLNVTAYTALMALLWSGRTLLLQGVHGQSIYFVVEGEVVESMMHAAKLVGEAWPVRHAYEVDTNIAEVAAP